MSSYRPPGSRRPPQPLPPRWVARERGVEMPPLSRFVVLSLLLHVLAITLFGAPSGGSREGRAMWGSLSVTLPPSRPDTRARPADPAVEVPAPAGPAPPAPQVEVPQAIPPILDRLVTRGLDVAPPIVPPPSEVPADATPLPPRPAPPAVSTPRIAIAPRTADAEPLLLEAPAVERALQEAPPVAALPPTPPATAALPAVPLPRIETTALPSSDTSSRPADLAPSPEIVAAPATPSPVERALPADDAASRPSPFRAPPAPGTAPAREEPSTTYDPTAAPSIDLDAVRARAAQLARGGSGQRAALPFPMPAIPPAPSKLERLIEGARKPDCRDAYKALGLAAIVPLIANQFGEGNCRW